MDRLRFAFLLTLMWSAAILAAVVAVFMTIDGAHAQALNCKPWVEAKVDMEKAGFHKVGIGLISEDLMVAIMETEGGAAWALVTIDSTGKSCLFQTGSDWTPFPEWEPPVPGRRPA
jgi:hypothetical protein